MRQGISLRTDYTFDDLVSLARLSKDAKQSRRLLCLSLIYDGSSRTAAARHGGVSFQTIRAWVSRFNAKGPEGLLDGKPTGAPPRLNAFHRQALARAVEEGPGPHVDGIVRWRLCDLVVWLHDRFGITLDETTLGRTLRSMGYRKLSARPRHYDQDPEALEAFRKTSPSG